MRYPPPAKRFLPTEFKVDTWEDVSDYYDELKSRSLSTVSDFEKWIADRSELDAFVSAEGSRRSIAAAQRTDDKEIEATFLAFETEFMTAWAPVLDELDKLFLESPFRHELDKNKWEVYDRNTQLSVELFRKENVPLQAQESELCNRYGQITGAMTVDFQGKERTLAALATFFESPDREVREGAWRAASTRRGQDSEALDTLFSELLVLREKVASNADFDDYRDYCHRSWGRFDYTPDDCVLFHERVEQSVLPLLRKMYAHRKAKLGVESLRPWDLAVDLDLAPSFEPFQTEQEHVDVTARILNQIDSRFAQDLEWMQEQQLLDLATRPHKRLGGFMSSLDDIRVPFIFANSGTTHRDVETLVHEAGHAVHLLRARELELADYVDAPLEFAEVASMGMEAMAMEHLAEVYPAKEAKRAVAASLESIASSLVWIAIIDAFQHWVYTHRGHSLEERTSAWVALRKRFDAGIDWTGLEDERAREWHKQLHLFEVPFYYIEYGIAQNGALQVWDAYQQNPESTIRSYCEGLSMGGSRPLPELFQVAGLIFDPSGELLPQLMNKLEASWLS